MSEPNTQLAERITVRNLLEKDNYKARFSEILGKRAPQFMASIVQVSSDSSLKNCEAKSIVAAACTAATLDLPIDKNLGFSHIVPYGDKAQFQIGYKGFIQLALRSGQFKSMRDAKINKEAFIGFDEITGDPMIDWSKLDESKEPIGYAFAWRLLNGFGKVVFWSKAEVEAHAKRFSQAYRAKANRSPWMTDFDAMALKTVIKNALAKWAPLSLEMQTAMAHDQGAQADLDADVIYDDNPDGSGEPEVRKPLFRGKKEEPKTVTPADPPATVASAEPSPSAPAAAAEPAPAPAPSPDQKTERDASESKAERDAAIMQIKNLMLDHDVSESKVFKYAVSAQLVPEGVDELFALPTATLVKLQTAIAALSTKRKP